MPAPANDNWASRTVIVGASGTLAGDTTDATVEGGEWHGWSVNFRGTVWYEWTCPADGKYSFWMEPDAPRDTWMSVFAHTGSLPTTPLDWLDEGGNNSPNDDQVRVNLDATLGTVYDFQCGKYQSGVGAVTSGPFVLNWADITGLAPAGDDFASPNVLANKTLYEFDLFYATKEVDDPWDWVPAYAGYWSSDYLPGERTMFHTITPDVTGTVEVRLQAWYDNSLEMGSITVYIFDGAGVVSITDLDAGAILDSNDEVYGTSTLSFAGVAAQTYWVWTTATYGVETPGPFFKIKARWPTVGPPPNDDWVNATTLVMQTWVTSQSTENATEEVGDPLPQIIADSLFYPNPATTTVWYTFTTPEGPANLFPEINMSIQFENVSDALDWVLFTF